MRLGDVVDELHDEHGLADAGATEQPNLSSSLVGRQQIDDLRAEEVKSAIDSIVHIASHSP